MDSPHGDGPLFRIGEIAAIHGISVRAMRLYEKMGVIKPRMVDAQTGYRFYSIEQARQISTLMELQALGFSLMEIKEVLAGEMDARRFRHTLIRKQTALHDSIAAARDKLSALERIVANMDGSKRASLLDELSEDERARLLAQMVCVEGTRSAAELNEAMWV